MDAKSQGTDYGGRQRHSRRTAVERKLFKNNDLNAASWPPLLGGDLNPLSGFYFPPFSMVFPWGISISVETCGSERKQKCGKLWSIYVQIFYVF